MEAALLLLILGVNVTLWTLIGGCRLASERIMRRPDRPHRRVPPEARLSAADVAVLIPAHNEEPVIAATIASVLRLVPVQNVHVIADGCDDATAAIARTRGVNVLELNPGRGKAGGIETAIRLLRLRDRYAVVLIADADTELDELYLERGLPMLDEPGVVALAGYARSSWRPQELSPVGRFLVSYRTRLYAVMQWLKYGQTWRWTNVTAIVPGFASMYRTSILDAMDLNPPGLVIEDFNMTFEVHRKHLGRIALSPHAVAYSQDPHTLGDYVSQVRRWNLGFWQTIRRHGVWLGWFWVAMGLFLLEWLVSSVLLLTVPVIALILTLPQLTDQLVLDWTWFAAVHDAVSGYVTGWTLLYGVVLPDYAMTCVIAIAQRRPTMLLLGLASLPFRMLDAWIGLTTAPKAWFTTSNGQWTSPTRR